MKPLLTAVAAIALFLLAACSSKPSRAQIEDAVRASLETNVPVSWVGNLMGGRNANVNRIEVVEWGSFNTEQGYWPVKLRVVGSAELRDPFNRGKTAQFDKVAEFRLRKDDYGKWQANLSGGMFQ